MRQRMTITSRKELLEVYKPQYEVADYCGKRDILNAFTTATGLSRKHSIALLNVRDKSKESRTRGRKPKLGNEALAALIVAWHLASHICSKRLVAFLPEILDELGKGGRLQISVEARKQLQTISAATIDRLLRNERRRCGRSPSTTKRAALVKNKVPVRTFTEWDNVKPGFFEADTVAHCSSSTAGLFLSTLNVTDIATCWTEPIALMRKGSLDVIDAFEKALELIPFPLLGIDSDNGSEFLNELLISWCEKNSVTFTRSREYKKNDQAWIEEKNRSIVRKHLGRARFEGSESWQLLCRYYSVLRLYINFFQPCQKLLFKSRTGAKTYKKLDVAKTPYQRVLDSEHVTAEAKQKLREQRSRLSMVQIHDEMTRLHAELLKVALDVPHPAIAVQAAQRIATFQFISRQLDTTMTKPLLSSTKLPRQRTSTEASPAKADGKNLKRAFRETISTLEPGTVITAKDFESFAARSTIDTYLHHFTQDGLIHRISWGKYQLPNSPISHCTVKPLNQDTYYPKKRRASVR